jgi:hypothetical protein
VRVFAYGTSILFTYSSGDYSIFAGFWYGSRGAFIV